MFIYTCNASFKANNNTIRRCHTSCFNKSFSSLSIRYGRYAVFGAHSTCESIVRTSSVRYTTRVSRTDVLSSGSYSVFPSYDFLTHSCSTSLFIFLNMSPSYCLNDELRTFSAVLTYFHTYRFFCSPIRSTSTRVMTTKFGYKALHGNTTLRSSMAQPSNTAYGVGNNNLADTHGNNSVSTAELINRGAVSSTINNGDMVSFYESCILEINKIAVEGKRVFRNHASSKKSSTVNRGSFTYLDDLDLPFSTNLCIRRFTYLNRRYARIRAHARKHRLYRVRVLRRTTYRRVRVALKGKVTRFLKKKHIDKKKHHIKKNAKKVHNTETKDKSKKKHYANKTNYHPPKAAYEEKNNYQHNYQHNYQYN
jgi:hypothetical protein